MSVNNQAVDAIWIREARQEVRAQSEQRRQQAAKAVKAAPLRPILASKFAELRSTGHASEWEGWETEVVIVGKKRERFLGVFHRTVNDSRRLALLSIYPYDPSQWIYLAVDGGVVRREWVGSESGPSKPRYRLDKREIDALTDGEVIGIAKYFGLRG